MYYPRPSYKVKIRPLASVLFLFISFFTLHSNAFADKKSQIAEEYRTKGFLEQQKGNYEQALTYYTKALSLGEENAVVFNDIGVVYEQFGVIDRAEESYLKAVKLDEHYLPPYMNLAYLYKRRGDMARAAQYFEARLRRSGKDDPWGAKAKAELDGISPGVSRKVLNDEAHKLAQELVDKSRDDFFVTVSRAAEHLERGDAFLAKNEFDKSIEEYDQALKITPDNPKILKAKKTAQYWKAVETIRKHSDLALHLLDVGDVVSAKEEFSKILSTIPSEPIQKSE